MIAYPSIFCFKLKLVPLKMLEKTVGVLAKPNRGNVVFVELKATVAEMDGRQEMAVMEKLVDGIILVFQILHHFQHLFLDLHLSLLVVVIFISCLPLSFFDFSCNNLKSSLLSF